ncbi:MAG: helix-turn-helix domain-containing protein [Bacteroidaceae bacterium]|nr:helix-turn-helix domain-containing protein [Bacteroidaceae bacterium]
MLIFLNANAADSKFDFTKSEFRNLRTHNGLTDLTVNVIYKDRDGYLYFGNGVGIDRFDGVRTISFPVQGSNEQLKKIRTITTAEDGTLYAGNGEGLLKLNLETKTLERIEPNILNFSINGIKVVGDTLYMATNQCLYKKSISTGEIKNTHTAHSTFSELNIINALETSPDKYHIWLTGKGVLHLYNIKNGHISTFIAPEPFNRIEFGKCIQIENKLLINTNVGQLISYDISGNKFELLAQFGRNALTSLGKYGKGQVYVSTDGNGIYFVDIDSGDIINHYHHGKDSKMRLSSNSVYATLIDDNGLLWIGYYQGGVDYSLFHHNTFEIYADDYIETNGMTVRAFAKYANTMLIGTREGLYLVDKDSGLSKFYDSTELNAEMIFAITRHDGAYYIGTYGGGVHTINPHTGAISQFCPTSKNLDDWKSLEVFALTTDTHGKLWVGTNRGVHCIYNNVEEKFYNSTNSPLPSGNVYEVYFDTKGTGWFCTENGIVAYDGKVFYTDNMPKSFNRYNKYRQVYEDSNGYLYFVPDRGPVVRTDLGLHKVELLKTPNRPASYWSNLAATFVIEDSENTLWLGTTEGLKRLKGTEARHFTNADGLPSPIFTLCKPVKDNQGDLWMGNTSGLIHLSMEKAASIIENADTIVFSQIFVNGKDQSLNSLEKGLNLSEGENNIRVLLSDLSYSSPAYMTYEYKIEGSAEYNNWNLLHGISEISIFNLPRGNYKLYVRKVGIPSSEVMLPITITKNFPWVNTIVIMCLLILVAALLIMLRQRRKVKEKVVVEIAPNEIEMDVKDIHDIQDEQKYSTMHLSDEECKRIVKKLEKIMKHDQPYRRPDLKIADLAEKVETSPNVLSFIFNIYMKSNYYDYINNYRIEAFKELIETADLNKYTLSSIGEKCGFSSRSSFFRSFKKATGTTPAEYIKSVGKNINKPNE